MSPKGHEASRGPAGEASANAASDRLRKERVGQQPNERKLQTALRASQTSFLTSRAAGLTVESMDIGPDDIGLNAGSGTH